MYTYQDFVAEKSGNINTALQRLIMEHMTSRETMIAKDADAYDRQKNTTVMSYINAVYKMDGGTVSAGANTRLCSNFFRRLNIQRNTYSLGNGVTFATDGLKERLGVDFDTKLRTAGYDALIHGVSFMFFNVDHVHVFPLTEFAPLWDEETGALRAGLRYWQIDHNKPTYAVLYEEDGYTKYRANGDKTEFVVVEDKRPYKYKTVQAPIDAEPEIIGEENYTSLPIVPLYGSRLHQSTLVGLKGLIDAYDLIASGYANDLQDCSEIYWIVTNAGGMDDEDLINFRNRLKRTKIANVDNADDVTVTPYTQEIPYQSRQNFLNDIRNQIYEGFGGLDVHAVAAGATNDHISAAYQPMDENADDFEYQIISSVQMLLSLIGVEDTPEFKRNRISNEAERTDMVLKAAQYLDEQTVLELLPFITPDMVEEILGRKDEEDVERFEEEPEEIEE